MKTIWLTLLISLCTIGLGIYFITQPTTSKEATPSTLRVGVLPDQNPETLHDRYDALLEQLSAKTGLDTKLVIPSDYDALIEMFRDGELELAYFGGLTFVKAHIFYDAEPLVMRDEDTRFTSWIIVKGTNTSHVLSDFKGKKFSFGSKLSTSGHLMPRYFLQQEKQIIAERYFSEVHYSGTHDKAAYQVRDGTVDLGAVNSEIVRDMVQDGRLKENDLRVLWETPPYPNYVWTVPANLDQTIKTQLRNAFLGFNMNDAVDGKVLADLNSEGFLPAGTKDFLILEEVALSLGLLDQSTK